MAKTIILALLATTVLYGGVLALLYTMQRSLEYFPSKTNVGPVEAGVPEAEVIKLNTADGETIVAWFLRRPGAYVAIYFHGNGNTLAQGPERIIELADLGVSVLAVDYRGYGASTGTPTEAGIHLDADAAYAKALRLGFAADHILLLGESLGSGVALELASRRTVAGIILDSAYSSVVDVAAERYWMFPVRRLLIDQYRSDLWIAKVHVPIHMLHGTDDWTVPIRFGRRLADLAGPNVTFVAIPGGGHVVFDEAVAEESVKRWLAKFGL